MLHYKIPFSKNATGTSTCLSLKNSAINFPKIS